MYGRVSDEDLRPISALLAGRDARPPRSCRRKAAQGRWRLKVAYADREAARRVAERDDSVAYLCRNCDFWQTGMLKGPSS